MVRDGKMRTEPHFSYWLRHPVLTTLLVLVAVSLFALTVVVLSFDAAGVALLPLAIYLPLTIPIALVPTVVYPLLVALRGQQELHVELERQARVDALTELPNRRAFFEFARSLVKYQGIVGSPLTALMIDVDRFKDINDRFGHDHGDIVLKRVAATILAEVMAAGAPRAMVARLGGEEFVALIEGLQPSVMGRLAERVCNQVHLRVGAGDRLEPVTVSIGVAFRHPGMGIDKLIKAADDAVYAAKRGGRDRWAFATEGGVTDAAAPGAAALQETTDLIEAAS